MDIIQMMKERHAVRSYLDKAIDEGAKKTLLDEIEKINSSHSLHFQLVTDEEKAFSGFKAHYGKFSGVKNYIVLAGKKSASLEEDCGYWGESLVLLAQSLGLNTCWVVMTYSKVPGAFSLEKGEKIAAVIALGYGTTSGSAHHSKPFSDVSATAEKDAPGWYVKGVEAALLAPTAMNQQKFKFRLDGKDSDGKGAVAVSKGLSFCTAIDKGIVKFHFEAAAGKENFVWK